METIDINKVAGLQALDAEGNALGIISLENLTDMVASRMATELASQNTAMPAMRTMSLTSSPVAASVAATGVDKTEAELSDVSDPGYVRVIDKTGNSGKQGMQQFASVVGGLLPTVTTDNNGLVDKEMYSKVMFSQYVEPTIPFAVRLRLSEVYESAYIHFSGYSPADIIDFKAIIYSEDGLLISNIFKIPTIYTQIEFYKNDASWQLAAVLRGREGQRVSAGVRLNKQHLESTYEITKDLSFLESEGWVKIE